MIKVSEIVLKALRFSIENEGQEIAYAWLYLIKNDQHKNPYGLLEDVRVILPVDRNKGHGTTLVQAVIARAKEEGCYKLIATSRFSRAKVHELYYELGFVSHGYEFRMDF